MVKKGQKQDLRSVKEEFEYYLSQVEKKFDSMLVKEKNLLDEHVYPVKELYLFINYLVDHNVFNRSHSGTKMFLAKTTSDLLAIYNCLNVGCPHQATQLVRSLFESDMNVQFIHGDFETRMELFYNHKYVQKYEKLNGNNNGQLPQNEYVELERNYNRIQRDYRPRSSWFTKHLEEIIRSDNSLRNRRASLKTLSQVIGKEDFYNSIYATSSLATHGSSTLDHLFIDNGRFQSGPINDLNIIKPIIGSTLLFAIEILKESFADTDISEEQIISYNHYLDIFLNKRL